MTDARVLITAPYFVLVVDRFRDRFEAHGLDPVVHEVEERADEEELLELVPGVVGVICGDDRFTGRVLERADRLEVISKWGTGIDSIDLEACRERGIEVRNTPDAFSHPVADTTLGFLLAFARRIPWTDREMKQGRWRKPGGHALWESTVGIVGVGNIGRRVASRVAAFGARLLGHDIRSVDPDVREATGLEPVGLDRLLTESDYVTLHCDLNETSRGLVGRPELARMQEDAVLVNTARGPVVDEPALVEALREGGVGGAALDVFEREPLPGDSPLRSMERVLLSPHGANASPKAWERVHESTFRNLVESLEESRER